MNIKMRARNAPRYQGTITSWKDDQGFGFISPNGGGPAVFVHITSFSDRGRRPAAEQRVTYALGTNEKGQARAEDVAFVRAGSARPASTQAGTGAPLAALGFLLLIALCVFAGKIPWLVFGLYLGLSGITFIAYALDKSAARNQRQRTRESTLHMFALFGGWPGALVAQQVLRHKSKKEAFRNTFRMTVLLNCGAFAWLLSPFGSDLLQLLRAA